MGLDSASICAARIDSARTGRRLIFWSVVSLLLLVFGSGSKAKGQNADPSPASLADVLAQAPKTVGPAPARYTTPYLVTRVVPKYDGGDTCYIDVVTNGMSYQLFADGLASCRHLPALHAIEWGCSVKRLTKDTIELVFSESRDHAKADTYFVRRSAPIPPDWTEDQ